MKSDLELAVDYSKQLESALERNLGAVGRGLHQKIDSVSTQLDTQTVKALRYVATIRNKIVHEDLVRAIDDREQFIVTCDRLVAKLSQTGHGPSVVEAPLHAHSSAVPVATVPTWTVPAWTSRNSFFDDFQDYRPHTGLALCAVAFLVATILQFAFPVCLIFGVVGLLLGLIFGHYIAGVSVVLLWIASAGAGIALIVWILYLIHGYFTKI